MNHALPSEMFDHYADIDETERLSRGAGELERIRTQDLIGRRLPQSRSVILDVGGAAGVHALWLARQGHEVHLIDPVPHHVERARRASEAQATHPLASCATGDARDLGYADGSVDTLFGPLYHLTVRADRLTGLIEAFRVLRPGGLIFAGAISRFASFLSSMTCNLLGDPTFVEIIRQDLRDGQHRNPTNNPQYFTTTFFHHPDELRTEVEETGFSVEKLVAIEGTAMWMRSFDADWQDTRKRMLMLEFLRITEEEPAMIGTSSHFLAICHK